MKAWMLPGPWKWLNRLSLGARRRIGLASFTAAGVAALTLAVIIYVRFPELPGSSDVPLHHRVFSPRPPAVYQVIRPGASIAWLTLAAHGAILALAAAGTVVASRDRSGDIWTILLAVHWWPWWLEVCRDWREVPGLIGDPFWQGLRAIGIAIGLLLGTWALCAVRQGRAGGWFSRRTLTYYVAAWACWLGALLLPASWLGLEPRQYAAVWVRAIAAMWWLVAVVGLAVNDRLAHPQRWLAYRFTVVTIVLVLLVAARFGLWVQRPVRVLHAVVPGKLYRSGQPGPRALWLLQRRYGIRTIVALRGDRLEEQRHVARRHGIQLINAQQDVSFTPSHLVSMVADPDAAPVLVHCFRGHNRTGTWIAAYRHLAQGWELRRACEEMEQVSGRPLRESLIQWLRGQFPAEMAAADSSRPRR